MGFKTISLAVTALAVSGSVNAGTLYAINNTTDHLTAIDTNTLIITDVGALGTDALFAGAAYNPFTETMYMIGGRGNNNLYTIDTNTGASSLVGSHGVNDLFGLAYDWNTSTLYGSQFSGGLGFYSLDVSTGSASLISNLAIQIGGLAYNSTIDEIVGINDGPGNLYTIDRTTGALTLLGGDGSVNDSGLTYDSDLNLYWDIDFSGNLFSYDPDTLTRTVHLTGLGNFDGLTYATSIVPVPAAVWLFGSGLIGLIGIARRKKS